MSGRVDMRKAMRQATGDAKFGRWPMVVAKAEDHETPVCIMRLPDFLQLFRQWYFSRIGAADE